LVEEQNTRFLTSPLTFENGN